MQTEHALQRHVADPDPTGLQPNLALRDLAANHGDRLYRFVYKHVGHPTDAEELAQQALCDAACSLASFRGESQLSTWVYGIANNLVRNFISRAPHRVYRFESEDVLEDMPSHTTCPRQQLEWTELVRMLSVEMAQLMPEMREVLLMISVDDMSYDEAATKLAVPVGTVRSRVSRARAHLRERFREAGAELPF